MSIDISWDRLNAIYKDGGHDALNAEWDILFEEIIKDAPEERQQQMRAMQFAYRRELDQIKNPQVRLAVAEKKMYDSFFKFQEALNNPDKVLAERNKRLEKGAKVIEFKIINKQD